MKKFNAGEMFKAKTDEDVSTAGRPSGVRKNRINYLQAKIAEFINELNALNKLENKNVVYELMSILDKE